ncbi:Glycosyltransferase involved in cell wall bisynthesis [Nonomuraea maritima]|uniref:Glycosyltransferase involved in cell wall bisynthesis n=1 Tax=Nonomuraea maritima TaxID=683260 RepID=A0A1G9B4T8_9ACTN|nr:glycosyltransferase family 4 protein [Nonomuraea maritima]SDK34561.1 Glycosyltransferase involved in cell wall bisynthesis [Nonomuraea maritima]
MKIRYMLLHAYGMGGTIRTVVNQANAMAEAGHDVEIVSTVRRRTSPQFEIDKRVKVWALVDQRQGVSADSLARRMWRRARGKIVPYGEFAAHYFTERVEAAVMEYVASVDDGILVTTRPALNLISARRGSGKAIRVAQEHMNLASYHPAVREQISRHYGAFDAIAVLTETSRAEYRAIYDDTPIVRIPNAVAMEHRKHSDQSNPVIVAAGRLVPQKGYDMLISAFATIAEAHPEWTVRIFGTGPSQEKLQARIDTAEMNGRVTLMGRSDRIHEELTDASIYALSSRMEGLPMAMIEAMGHALPVVAFDCPTGPADLITQGRNGVLVPPRDVEAFGAELSRLIGDVELRRRLGAAAAETAREYTPETVMPLWEGLFTALSNRAPIARDYGAAH